MSAEHIHRALDLLFVVDPVETLNPGHDTSVALMESAQARGHRVLVTTMPELEIRKGRAAAPCTPVNVQPAVLRDGRWQSPPDWFTAGPRERRVLEETDAIFVRTDPPVDATYLRGTYILDLVDPSRALVLNRPSGLRNANEKLFALRWPDLCPDTLVTASPAEIISATDAWGTAVIKPTDGMAGRGIMLLRDGDPNLRSIIDTATSRGRDQVVIQRYIEQASEGDRRVIVLGGEPIGVVRRVASGREFRCNMATGASVVADTITVRDREICARLAPAFAEAGLVFVGLDIIGDYLTEINVTSPTGVREIDAFDGTRLSDRVMAWVEEHTARPAPLSQATAIRQDRQGAARTAGRRAAPGTPPGKRIGIIGAGTAGLQLGLYLRQHGVDVTIITDRSPAEVGRSRLPNTVAHHAVTLERERALGIDHWPTGKYGYYGHEYYIGAPEPIRFRGGYHAPSRAVDYRIYHPQLMEDFTGRGGTIEYRPVVHDDVSALAARFDLLVVSTGKGPFGQMFGRIPGDSPFDRPQRTLCVGVFCGIEQQPTRSVVWSASPDAGEMIEIPFLTFGGLATALVFENHVGGDLDALARASYEEDAEAFRKLILEALRTHYPATAERVDPAAFDLAGGPLDLLQGGVTPAVRRSHILLDGGTLALSLGDVKATVDPLLGQGANVASHGAWVLGEEIVRQDVYDSRFVEQVERKRDDRVLAASRWTNFMLQALRPLSPEFQQVLAVISENKGLADEFTDDFNYPEQQWDRFATPGRTAAWLDRRPGG
jgi:glutathione synthetase